MTYTFDRSRYRTVEVHFGYDHQVVVHAANRLACVISPRRAGGWPAVPLDGLGVMVLARRDADGVACSVWIADSGAEGRERVPQSADSSGELLLHVLPPPGTWSGEMEGMKTVIEKRLATFEGVRLAEPYRDSRLLKAPLYVAKAGDIALFALRNVHLWDLGRPVADAPRLEPDWMWEI